MFKILGVKNDFQADWTEKWHKFHKVLLVFMGYKALHISAEKPIIKFWTKKGADPFKDIASTVHYQETMSLYANKNCVGREF